MKRQEEEAEKEASAGKSGREETTEEGAAPSGMPTKPLAQGAGAPQAPQKPPAQAPEPSPAPSPEAAADRKVADAAFDLGLVYRRMGLSEESSAEFAKAREIYAACLAGGARDPDIAERLAQIEASEAGAPAGEKVAGGGESGRREVKSEVSPEESKSNPEGGKSSGKREEQVSRAPEKDAKPTQKKKVSFV